MLVHNVQCLERQHGISHNPSTPAATTATAAAWRRRLPIARAASSSVATAPPATTLPAPPATVVIGPGRVGRALLRMADPRLGPAIAVSRGDELAERLAAAGIASDEPCPLIVTTTNDALDQVIAGCPPARRPDLVITQNGMLLPVLERHGLMGCTQALMYLAASHEGSVVDGGRTVACGRHVGGLCSGRGVCGHTVSALPDSRPACCQAPTWPAHTCMRAGGLAHWRRCWRAAASRAAWWAQESSMRC